MADLLFKHAASSGAVAHLLFGEGDSTGVPPVEATLTGTFPLSFSARVRGITKATLTGTFPPLVVAVHAAYNSNTQRPTTAKTDAAWQEATRKLTSAVGMTISDGVIALGEVLSPWQHAVPVGSQAASTLRNAVHAGASASSAFQDGRRASVQAFALLQDARRGERMVRVSIHQDAQQVAAGLDALAQDALRDRRIIHRDRHQDALRNLLRAYTGRVGSGRKVRFGNGTQFQDAGHVVHGVRPPTPPDQQPCYTPNPDLLFLEPQVFTPNLFFRCSPWTPPPIDHETVVVPVKKVYIVLNETSLKRVDGNIDLPTFTMNATLDYQSWTWSFSASLPRQAEANVQPSAPGVPVEVEAMINGTAFRFVIERRQRTRTFGKASITVSGRGRAALLDEPYAPVLNFNVAAQRTHQQLFDEVLQWNAVSLGWTVDYQLEDWTVPGGLFAHQGSYISAINALVEAGGAYLQPHNTDKTLRVLPLYPTAPWDWGTITPDFELPAAVTTQEGIEWIDRARYNRVYVTGTRSGVLGRVTRAGTAGDIVAPMIVSPLNATAAAARQRGLPVLANTGSSADVTLKLPVLAETGVITPGAFVDYVDEDGLSRRGIVRSVGVEAGHPEVWQTLKVETR